MTTENLVMQKLPLADRPYEKLASRGEAALTETELLAIIIGSGRQGQTALGLAQEMLATHHNLAQLVNLSLEELQTFRGIGLTKAVRIKAALELGLRANYPSPQESYPTIASAQTAIGFLEKDMLRLEREELHMLLLNNQGRLIRKELLAVGGLNAASIFPRDIFRQAIKANAAGIILCHNHPSGSNQPSPEDISMSLKLVKMGEELGVRLLDHIIVARQGSVSLKALGHLS
ncbi:MAG: DNA repair protein RadC [Eubacteriales bacterium]|nr:DNA repair protein RadC [Eubacteriales bacterium]